MPGRTPAWPLGERPGFLLRRLHQIHVALFMEACGAFGVTPVQYSLLSALALRGRADQTVLASDVVLDRTTTAGALRRLEARGLIRRVISATDRRARDCRMTAKGRALLARIEPAARAAHEATIAALGAEEQALLLTLLKRAVAANAARPPHSTGLG